MAEALVSPVVEQLVSIMAREVEQEVRLVVGVENAVDQLTSNLTAIQAVLADAESKQGKAATVRNWLKKLKDVAYDIEDVLDDWEAAILSSQSKPGHEKDPKEAERKVCSFLRSSCFCCKQVVLRHDIARKIKELNERLDRIAQQKDRYQVVQKEGNPPIERFMTTSMIDKAEETGGEEDKNVLVNKLLSESRDADESNFNVLSIVGMGGIGKTTLAQFAFNHNSIETQFNMKIWVCVSDPFDEMKIATTILESILGHAPQVTHLQNLLGNIKETMKGKKFLLVLDDVWEKNSKKWDQLKQSLRSSLPGSKVLITTRNEKVAFVMGCSKNDILHIRTLSEEECWSILSKIAFINWSDTECKIFENVGREISKKCRGLPLIAKTLGGVLQFRKTIEQWQSILYNDMWEFEGGEKDVIAPLWLSYYDLSPELRRCFSYCAIFSKDYMIKKRELIELWMAQGYLKEGQSDNLEITGEIYFENLVMRCFFQDFTYDYDDRSISCKMHDIVHDLAQIVARDECVAVEVNGQVESIIGSPSSKMRHLGLDCTNRSHFKSFDGTKKLRSLLIWGLRRGKLTVCRGLRLTTEELSKLFSESTHVRSLSLKHCDFEEIPSSISKLVHLRWLDLSWNEELKHLDEALCELHSLQTLDVFLCRNLRLPFGIGKLINLRHLHNKYGPSRLPKGIAELTGLRTLEWVDVGCDDDEDAFSLGDLKNLNQLRGFLIIRGLGARDRHVGEAKQAELKKKEHITDLELRFLVGEGFGEREGWCTPRNEELLLEALEPSPYLEILEIKGYRGATFPGWMISLTNLRSLSLNSCESCEHLPSLGKLPSLETLKLWSIWSVKKVGVKLSGIETQITESKSEISASSSSYSLPVVVAFPKLTTFKFFDMPNWEEWDDYYDDTTKPPPAIQIMSSLLSLEIWNCPRLKALPNYILQNTTLQSLGFSGSCNLLKERYNKETGEDWSKISHISHVTF